MSSSDGDDLPPLMSVKKKTFAPIKRSAPSATEKPAKKAKANPVKEDIASAEDIKVDEYL
jgi:hypothetical protein